MSSLQNTVEHIERKTRKRTYKRALITHQNIGGNKVCTLRNVSETGALLVLEEMSCLPQDFIVQIEIDATKVPVRRVRQNGTEIGVEFTGPFKSYKSSRSQVLSQFLDHPAQQDNLNVEHVNDASYRPSSLHKRRRCSKFGRRSFSS